MTALPREIVDGVLVVGAGLAGLSAALAAAPLGRGAHGNIPL